MEVNKVTPFLPKSKNVKALRRVKNLALQSERFFFEPPLCFNVSCVGLVINTFIGTYVEKICWFTEYVSCQGTHNADSIIESKVIYYLDKCGLRV